MDKHMRQKPQPFDPELSRELANAPMDNNHGMAGEHGSVFASNPAARKITDAERDLDLTAEEIKALDVDQVMDIASHHIQHFTGIHQSIMAQWQIQKSLSESQLDNMRAFLLTHSKQFRPEQH